MTLTALILGALSADGALDRWGLVGLLIIGLFVHIAVFQLNDLADRRIDRTDPRRAGFPIVTGDLSAPVATVVAIGSLIVSAVADVAFFEISPDRMTMLYLAYAGFMTYDLAGKRCRWPVLTDAAQGLGGAALVLYGATTAGAPTTATWLVALYAMTYLMLVTGLHGGVRDVENDRRHGARTLAVLSGARRFATGVEISAGLRRYALSLQLLLAGIAITHLVYQLSFADRHASPLAAALLGVLAAAASSVLLRRALRRGQSATSTQYLGAVHIIVAYLPAVAVAVTRRGVIWLLIGTALVTAPLMANPWFRRGLLVSVASRKSSAPPGAR